MKVADSEYKANTLPKILSTKSPRLKLVFGLLVRTFIGILNSFLTGIAFDLAKILLFFRLLILFFHFNSIDANGKSYAIFST